MRLMLRMSLPAGTPAVRRKADISAISGSSAVERLSRFAAVAAARENVFYCAGPGVPAADERV